MKRRFDASLSDHKRVGRRLVAPWNQVPELGLTETSWLLHRLPEIVWIGELIHFLGPKASLKIVIGLARAAHQVVPNSPPLVVAASWTTVDQAAKRQLKHLLKQKKMLLRIQSALHVLFTLYPQYPLAFLRGSKSMRLKAQDIADFKSRLALMFSRFERPALRVMAHALVAQTEAGRLKFLKGIDCPDLNVLYVSEKDVDPDEFARTSGFVRSTAMSLIAGLEHTNTSTRSTAQYFWSRGLELEGCETEALNER